MQLSLSVCLSLSHALFFLPNNEFYLCFYPSSSFHKSPLLNKALKWMMFFPLAQMQDFKNIKAKSRFWLIGFYLIACYNMFPSRSGMETIYHTPEIDHFVFPDGKL